MKPPRILVLYKSSFYEHYMQGDRTISPFVSSRSHDLRRFKQTHDAHFCVLEVIRAALKKERILHRITSRRTIADFDKYDGVITVGGDGTFLQGARSITDQWILGVNSDPLWSVGKLCTATVKDFPAVLRKIVSGKVRMRLLHRLVLNVKSHRPVHFLNDILVCHRNPAAMCRYHLTVNGRKEEHKSSGIWIATAAGSTGAVNSAGGKRLALTSRAFQYMPRELYAVDRKKYRHRGGVLKAAGRIAVTSLMQGGMIFVDGCHLNFPFRFGQQAVITRSPYPLKVIQP